MTGEYALALHLLIKSAEDSAIVTRFFRSLSMTQQVSEMRIALIVAAAFFFFPTTSMSRFMTSEAEFNGSTNVAFTWSEAQSRSVQIFLEYRDPAGAWQRVILGSGFLLSPDGLFVTAYHVMTYCLKGLGQNSVLATKVDCSTSQVDVRYVAVNQRGEFAIESSRICQRWSPRAARKRTRRTKS